MTDMNANDDTAAPASNGGGDDVDWQARALKAERAIKYALRHLPKSMKETSLWTGQETVDRMINARTELEQVAINE